MIADHHGEVVGAPAAFALNEPGVRSLEEALRQAVTARKARSVRIGIETAGHYHRPLLSRLAASHDVVELNPGQVKSAREAQGSAKIKNDVRDCAAIVDLVISGMGWSTTTVASHLGPVFRPRPTYVSSRPDHAS